MFGLEMLDVLIGLVTVYLVFGMACTAVVEAISAWFGVRSNNLETALKEFFAGKISDQESFVKAFYGHPVIQSLSKGEDGRPSYIPPELVGQVVQSLLLAKAATRDITVAVQALPGSTESNRVKGLLDTLVAEARGDAQVFRKSIEMHFNATMERASGWYKRYTQNIAFAVAALLVIAANVDTLALTTSLASNPAARVKMVEVAEKRLAEVQAAQTNAEISNAGDGVTLEQATAETQAARASLDKAVGEMSSAEIRLGWQDYPESAADIVSKVVGLLVSIFAVSLGAPFWFDILQRFMRVRMAGRKSENGKAG